MDIVEDGHSGKVLIQFANRIDDEGMLKDALRRMVNPNRLSFLMTAVYILNVRCNFCSSLVMIYAKGC